MKRLAVLTLLTAVITAKSFACIVASDSRISCQLKPHLVFGANATSYYGFGLDKAYHFDANHMGVDGYVGIETPKRYATFVLNGGAVIDRSSYHVGADILIDPLGWKSNAVILPKFIAAGGYRNMSGLSKGYAEVGIELVFGRRSSIINVVLDSRVGTMFGNTDWYNINRVGLRVNIP